VRLKSNSLRHAALLRAAMMTRSLAARSAALRFAGGYGWSCCQATAAASTGRTAPRGSDDTELGGKVGRAPVGGRSASGFVLPHLQARRMMIRSLEANRAALGLRAVASLAQTGDLLGKIGFHASMAEGKQNSNYAFKPIAEQALRSN
jgi:hypothetical protein